MLKICYTLEKGTMMKERLLITGLITVVLMSALMLIISFPVAAQEENPAVEETEPESLLFMDMPMVYASSRRLQSVNEAAASIEIITAEDIRQSGATSIAGVLASISGVHIEESSGSDQSIGIRGVPLSQHVLITLDGNGSYLEKSNFAYLPIDLDEIERIEVVKGPAAVFYGGYAFSGVINIVTRTPDRTNSTELNAAGGNFNTRRSNLLHNGYFKKWDYSVDVGNLNSEYMARSGSTDTNHYSLKTIYHKDDDTSVTLNLRQSNYVEAVSGFNKPKNDYVSLQYEKPDFRVSFFYNEQVGKSSFDSNPPPGPPPDDSVHEAAAPSNSSYALTDRNREFEIARILRWNKNITSISVTAKKNDFSSEHNGGGAADYGSKNYALSAENEHRVSDRLIFTVGDRLEHSSESGTINIARVSLIYNTVGNRNLRFTVANGYNTASILHLSNPGDPSSLTLSNSLNDEKILSYEFSYSGQISRRVKSEAALFYNEYGGLFGYDTSGSLINAVNAYQHGLELGFDFYINNILNGFFNYSYQQTRRFDLDENADSNNMFNFGLRARSGKWSSYLAFHYTGAYYNINNEEFHGPGADHQSKTKVDSLTTADARIAYTLNDRLEFSLSSSNLFDTAASESKAVNQSGPSGLLESDSTVRRITAGATYSF
jgi:outer membrane receptor for ferrienterochelin and colicin